MYNLTDKQIKDLAATSTEAKAQLTKLFPQVFATKELVALDLTQVRTAGTNALSIPHGGFGRQILVTINQSPYHLYPNKSLLVGQNFRATVVDSEVNGVVDQLIVFENK